MDGKEDNKTIHTKEIKTKSTASHIFDRTMDSADRAYNEHPIITLLVACCIGLIVISILGNLLLPDTNTSSNYESDYDNNKSFDTSNMNFIDDDYNYSQNNSNSYSNSSNKNNYTLEEVPDMDGDGKMSIEEFAEIAYYSGYTEDDAEDLAEIFVYFDSNNDDYWDIYEYNTFLNY